MFPDPFVDVFGEVRCVKSVIDVVPFKRFGDIGTSASPNDFPSSNLRNVEDQFILANVICQMAVGLINT